MVVSAHPVEWKAVATSPDFLVASILDPITRDLLFQRLRLLLVLVPIACGWGWFLCTVPVLQWNHKRFAHEHRVVYGDWVFDFSTQTATRYVDDSTAASMPPNANGVSYRQNGKLLPTEPGAKSSPPRRVVRNTVYDHRTKQLVHDFELPIDNILRCHFVTDRFYMIQSQESIEWLDLRHGTKDWQSIPNPELGDSFTWPHPSQPVIRCTYRSSISRNHRTTHLYRFQEDGQIQLLASWPHLTSTSSHFYDVKFSGDRVYTVDTTGAFLESRSIVDGSLIESIPFDAPLAAFNFSLSDDYVMERGNFIGLNGKVLERPFDGTNTSRLYPNLSSDGKTCVWYRSERSLVTNAETGEVICEIQEPGDRYEFLDSETLVSTSPGWGLTLRQHDLTTGKTLSQWSPFWWMWPSLAVLLVLSAIWTWSWVHFPKRITSMGSPQEEAVVPWGWIDFYVLLALSLAGLVARVLSVGFPEDVSRLSYLYAQAISISSLFLAWYMVFFSAQRWIVRVIRLLATYGIILIALVAAMRGSPLEACQGLFAVSLPAVYAMPFWTIGAVLAWRSRRRKDVKATETVRQHRIQMKDLFWLTGIAAVVLIAIRPLLPGMGARFQFHRELLQLVWAALCTWVGLGTGLTPNKRWARVGVVLCLVSAGLFGLSLVMLAIEGPFWQHRFLNGIGVNGFLVFHCSYVFATSFLFARCLKVSDR
jgi:hypothetical protein